MESYENAIATRSSCESLEGELLGFGMGRLRMQAMPSYLQGGGGGIPSEVVRLMLERMIDALGPPGASATQRDFQTALKLVGQLLSDSEKRLEAAKWRLHWYEGFLATGHKANANAELVGLRNSVEPVTKVMLY